MSVNLSYYIQENVQKRIFRYSQEGKEDKTIEQVFKSIVNNDGNRLNNELYHTNQEKYLPFEKTVHKDIYRELLKLQYQDHP